MKILFLLLASAMQTVAWSQNWIDSYSDESVSIQHTKINYVSASDGIHHERIIFKYVNRTDEDIQLSFDRKVSYNLEELAESPERTFEVLIPANTTMTYGDDKKHDKTFYIFSADMKGTIKQKLSGFEVINVEYKQK